MRRREFITLLGGAAAAWPLSTRAQPERMRRVGVLVNLVENDPEAVARLTALQGSLRELGWVEGRNLQIDARWGVDNERIRNNAEASVKARVSPKQALGLNVPHLVVDEVIE